MNASVVTIAENKFALRGPLTFDTVPDVLGDSRSWLKKGAEVTIDLKQVSKADSAGLALLIEWLRLARLSNCKVHFINFPPQFRSLIDVTGLQQALAITE
jgi:phospholipid transport system transporter-binding protein